jgi:hypothetical protein
VNTDRIIMHVDVNSAYLSWEAVYRLQHGDSVDLRTIPSVIGGDQASRHGIVLAKSIPAKKMENTNRREPLCYPSAVPERCCRSTELPFIYAMQRRYDTPPGRILAQGPDIQHR